MEDQYHRYYLTEQIEPNIVRCEMLGVVASLDISSSVYLLKMLKAKNNNLKYMSNMKCNHVHILEPCSILIATYGIYQNKCSTFVINSGLFFYFPTL